jgi:hypothetical protein
MENNNKKQKRSLEATGVQGANHKSSKKQKQKKT